MDDQTVTFRYKDYAHGNRPRTMTLQGDEFLRRFLMHAVPCGFMRIRHFGLLANRVRAKNLACLRRLLADACPASLTAPQTPTPVSEPLPRCPVCGRGRLFAGPNLSACELAQRLLRVDSS